MERSTRQRLDLAFMLLKTSGNPSLTGVFIQAVHITEMRTALGQVYEEAGETQPTYTDPTLAPGVMKAAHISELRASVAAIE